MKSILLKARLVFFYLAGFSIAAMSLVFVTLESGVLIFKQLEINWQNQQANEGTSLNIMDVKKDLSRSLNLYKGKNVLSIDLEQLRKEILRDKRIAGAQLQRVYPAKIKVNLILDSPLAVLLDSRGRFIPVGQKAGLLKKVKADKVPDLPLMIGEVFEKDKSLRQKALSILQFIPEHGVFSHRSIAEIHYTKNDGFWFYLIKDRVKVLWGKHQDPETVNRISQVIRFLHKNRIENRVIDASLSKKVLVRPRNDS